MLEKGISVTHEHLLSILNTEARCSSDAPRFRILDAGCGDGVLLAYLASKLPLLIPNASFELHGFDVDDHGVQTADFLKSTIHTLTQRIPNVKWGERIVSVSSWKKWPYEDGFFDFIISNQVVEHVKDHDHFFSEIGRTLANGGRSVHVFPLKNYILESHLGLPWVHRIRNYDFLRGYIRALSRLHLGKFPYHRRTWGRSLEQYSEIHADYMHYFTNYIAYGRALELGKNHNLRASFKYTRELYLRKLFSILRMPCRFEYRRRETGFLDMALLWILRYVSIVTLYLEKKEVYRAA
jgi:SAM-dependent methyltransferase